MPYKFPQLLVGLSRKHIDEDGNQLLTPAITMYGTLGAFVEFAVGITASGIGYDQKPETVYDRTFSMRWKFYTQQGSANPTPSANGFRFKTGGAPAAAAPMEFFASNGALLEPNQNFSATLEVVSSTQVTIRFRFYLTSEDANYAPFAVNNLNRILASKNAGAHMELEDGSQIAIGATGVSLVVVVSDGPQTVPPSPAFVTVTRSTGAKEYWTPIQMKWPGRNVGNTAYEMYLDTFSVETLNGDIVAAKTHRDTTLPHQSKYDENFTVTSASISAFEDNIFSFVFKPGIVSSFTATSVRAILVRTDNVDNEQWWTIAQAGSIANIPANDTTQDNIAGAIYAPASFTNGSGEWTVSFRVPGNALAFGASYRCLCIMYGTTFGEIYSGVSHELKADLHPNFYPKLDTFIADYFKESPMPYGIMAYHSAFRARFELHKRTITDAFTYYGISGTAGNNLEYIRGDIMRPGTESATDFTANAGAPAFLWQKGSGLVAGVDFSDSTDYMFGAFYGWIDEEWLPYAAAADANYYISIMWEVGISSLLPNGQTVLLKCQVPNHLVARRWESEAGQPSSPSFVLSMGIYKANGSTIIPPGTQYACGAGEVVAIVEKTGGIADPVDAFAIPETYAETATGGNTSNANIRQRRPALGGFIPAAVNSEINLYDEKFSDDGVFGAGPDDSGAKIEIMDLPTTQRQWFVMLARPDNADAAPYIATTPTVQMVRDGSNITTVTADFTAWKAAFDTHVTGASSVNDFRIQNIVTQNFAGITAGGSGNPSSDPDICEVTIDHKKTPMLAIEVIYDIQGTITVSGDPHLVRFMVRGYFTLPTSAGSSTVAINPSDWKIIDYDF